MIAAYGEYMKGLACIEDWLFSVIEPEQDDEGYWNGEAQRMIAAGVVVVRIGDAVFDMCSIH